MSKKKIEIDIAGVASIVIVQLVVFAFGYGVLNARVNAQADELKEMVPRSEHESVQKWQAKYEEAFNKRMDRIEAKLDQLMERESRR